MTLIVAYMLHSATSRPLEEHLAIDIEKEVAALDAQVQEKQEQVSPQGQPVIEAVSVCRNFFTKMHDFQTRCIACSNALGLPLTK